MPRRAPADADGERVMKRLALALLLAGSLAACGEPVPPDVTEAWTRDTVGSTASAAVFMTITAPVGDRLVAASTPVAKQTDLMTMKTSGNAMTMAYVGKIDLPAGKPVSLNATGLHVWLAGLTHPLKAGETFPLTLEFEQGGQSKVIVSVIAPAAAAPMAGMDM
jgi:periplasmic copper chaperone A